MLSKDNEIIINKLEVMDEKLNTLVTQRAIHEHRIKRLEETQSGVIKFTLTAVVTSIGALISAGFKYIIGG